MLFDDWAYHTDIRNMESKVLSNNETGKIWSMPYFKELMHVIRHNQDIEAFINDKNQKLHDEYMRQEAEESKQRITELTNKSKDISKHLDEIVRISTILNNFRQDIENILTKHNKIININALKSFLYSYLRKGVFEKDWAYNTLMQPSGGIINNFIKSFSFKKLKKDVDVFVQKYEQLNIPNIIDNLSISQDRYYKTEINNFFEQILSLDWQHVGDLESAKNTLIEQRNTANQQIEYANNIVEILEESFQNSKVISKEDSLIRSFAQEIRQEIKNPKKLEPSNYVIYLNSMPDDEIVVFNIGLTNKNADGSKIKNILEYNNLESGNQINQWCIRREIRDNSDKGKFELFSPLMTVKEAKTIMPKLIADFDRAHVSSGLIVPIKAGQLFANWNTNFVETEINQNDLKQLIFGAILRQDLQSHGGKVPNMQQKIQELGFGNQEELPHAFYSLDELKEKYPKDKFLFSGSTASDDYLLISGRVGRTGTVYATPHIEYAAIYDGVSCGERSEGTTATGDKYVSSVIGKISDQDIKIGFINVYQQNPKDMYFSNFGVEDYRQFIGVQKQPRSYDMCEEDDGQWKIAHKQGQNAPNARLNYEQAIHGYAREDKSRVEIDGKNYLPWALDSETFVTPEKNPLHEKILHIKWNGHKLYIPVSENKSNEIINAILNKRKADVKQTFQDVTRADVFYRLQEQERQYKKRMFEKGINKIEKEGNIGTINIDYDR